MHSFHHHKCLMSSPRLWLVETTLYDQFKSSSIPWTRKKTNSFENNVSWFVTRVCPVSLTATHTKPSLVNWARPRHCRCVQKLRTPASLNVPETTSHSSKPVNCFWSSSIAQPLQFCVQCPLGADPSERKQTARHADPGADSTWRSPCCIKAHTDIPPCSN